MKSNNLCYFYFIKMFIPWWKQASTIDTYIQYLTTVTSYLIVRFFLIFNFSSQLGFLFLFFFNSELETAFHIHLPISKRTIKKNLKWVHMTCIVLPIANIMLRITQNIPSKQASQPIIKQFTIWNHLARKWIMNSDILKHALQSWPAHLGWFHMKTYKAPPLNPHTALLGGPVLRSSLLWPYLTFSLILPSV